MDFIWAVFCHGNEVWFFFKFFFGGAPFWEKLTSLLMKQLPWQHKRKFTRDLNAYYRPRLNYDNAIAK